MIVATDMDVCKECIILMTKCDLRPHRIPGVISFPTPGPCEDDDEKSDDAEFVITTTKDALRSKRDASSPKVPTSVEA